MTLPSRAPMQAAEDTPARSAWPTRGPGGALELVVAVAANGVIGARNELPWRLPADLRHFRRLTTGHAVLMGRKTWDAIGRPLPDRQNIVITRRDDWQATGADVAHSVVDAIACVRLPDPVFCIGGGEIFREALPLATRMHVTEIAESFEGDAFFPAFDRSTWRATWREEHRDEDEAPFAYAFVTYDRVA
jgi:dihydrofolate reductase